MLFTDILYNPYVTASL